MYILKNALVSITRNKGRNLLIAIIVVVISCATTITLAIRSSAQNLIESYENQYDVTATIGINRDSMRSEMKMNDDISEEEREINKSNMANIFESVSNITEEDIKSYGNSDYVKDYYYTLSVGVNSNNLEKVSIQNDSGSDNSKFMGRKENFQNISTSDFTLTGYSSLSSMKEFISGKYSITDGEISSDLSLMNCVVNSELASSNNIKVGDEIVFVDPDNESNLLTLTISGIFEETSSEDEAMGMFTTSANLIITNVNAVNSIIKNNDSMKKTVTPTFILKSKDVIEKFENELKEKGLSDYLTLSTNLDQVEGATSTISNVNKFATTFLIITLIIGGIVLFVINMINIRERKYEIGVLRTIGMKKFYLTLQFVFELLIVLFAAMLIGAGIGAASSVSVSNHLLENEIANNNTQIESINKNFGGNIEGKYMGRINGTRVVQAYDSIDAAVNLKVLLELLLIGTALTLISSSASMISIQKFSPLTILKERS